MTTPAVIARGQRIAGLRKAKHLTQQAAADRLQVSYRAYQSWEAGTMPNWPNLTRLAELLEVTPEELLDQHRPEPGVVSPLAQIELQLLDVNSKVDQLLKQLTGGDDVVLAERESTDGKVLVDRVLLERVQPQSAPRPKLRPARLSCPTKVSAFSDASIDLSENEISSTRSSPACGLRPAVRGLQEGRVEPAELLEHVAAARRVRAESA